MTAVDVCHETFKKEYKASPLPWWNPVLKWMSYKCFKAGWFNYMGSPIPYAVAKTIEHYGNDPHHFTAVWFGIGYLAAKWHIEGRPTCSCCGEPVQVVIERQVEEDTDA